MTYTLTYEVEVTIEADNGWEAKEEGYEVMKDACQNRLEFRLVDCREE